MLILLVSLFLICRCMGILGSPQLMRSANSTVLSSPGSLITNCPNDCYRDSRVISYITWSQASVTTTITAATVILIVNDGTNTTRTSTVYNQEFDTFINPTPTALNNLGTQLASLTRVDGGSIITHAVAYPTIAYGEYGRRYSICGTFSTTVGGKPTCVRIQNCTGTSQIDVPGGYLNTRASSYSYPSYLPILYDIQSDVDMLKDPRGWTYVPFEDSGCDTEPPMQSVFPDLQLWSCKPMNNCIDAHDFGGPQIDTHSSLLGDTIPTATPAQPMWEPVVAVNKPAVALQTALFLTVTSTSTQASESNKARLGGNTVLPNIMALPTHEQTTNDKHTTSTTTLRQVNDFTKLLPTIPHPKPLATASVPTTTDISLAVPVYVPLMYTDAEGSAKFSGVTFPATLPTPHLSSTFVSEVTTPPLKADASTPESTVVKSYNAQGIPIFSNPHLPALISTAQDADGSLSLVASSPNPTAILGKASFPPVLTGLPILTIGAQSISANAMGQYIIGTQTLIRGSQITVSGTLISLEETALVVGDTTLSIHPIIATQPAAFAIDKSRMMANSFGQSIVDGQTITPSGTIPISDTQMSLSTSEMALITDSNTQTSVITTPPMFTVGTQIISANSLNQYIVDGQTIAPGDVITVMGTRVSVEADGTDVIVGTSTEALGALIRGGFSGGPNNTIPSVFTGATERMQTPLREGVAVLLMGLVALMCL